MKVLLVNGGPHKNGCTYTALTEIEKEFINNNIYNWNNCNNWMY